MSHVENDEKKKARVEKEEGSAVDRKKIPCVSTSEGEIKCGLREWRGIQEQGRIKTKGKST